MTISQSQTEFNSAQFREALGRFTTGVAIVTCPGNGAGPVGVTVNSFTSLSLDPPLVLWCLDNKTGRGEAFLECDFFTANILERGQEALSVRFAVSGQHDFAGVEYNEGNHGSPLLPDALAHFECAVEARYPGGDHTIIVGRVTGLDARAGDPLLYYRGQYRDLRSGP